MESQTFFRVAWRSGLCPAGVFFMLLGGIFVTNGGLRLIAELRYREQGVRVQGAVVSKSIERASGKESSTRYLVSYRFDTAEGVAMQAADEVDVDRWEELKQGDLFEIVYLPESPASSRSSTTTDMPLAVAFTAVGAFTLLVGAVVFLTGARAAWRQSTPQPRPGASGLDVP